MADPRLNPSSYFGNFPGTSYGTYGPPAGPSVFGANPTAPTSAVEGMLQSILPMVSEFFRSKTGGFGFNFGSDMNIAQSQFAREFMQQATAARTEGGKADAGEVSNLIRGMASMIGHRSVGKFADGRLRFEDDTERAITRMSQDAGAMLPLLASMFPDYVDKALPRGSMAVAAGNFVNAGRFIVDPATGRPMSEDSQLAARILGPLMSRGPDATAGLGAGRLGQTFEALANNGLISGGSDLRKMVETGQMTGDDARDLQASRVRDQIAKYSKTVAAINDIFAEAGRPNAPMKELINGLQAMTQGGLTGYDAPSLERVVRTLHGASQMTGIGLGGVQEMVVGSAALLGRYGGHQLLAAPIAWRAMAMGQVFKNGNFGLPSPEGMSVTEWNAVTADKAAAGAGSDFGNLVGAILAQAENAPAGSPIKQLAAAISTGGLTGGGVDLRTATQADLTGLMTRSGLDQGALNAQLRATRLNQAMLVRGGSGVLQTLGAAQGAEVDARFSQMFGADLAGRGIDVRGLLGVMHEVASAGGHTSDIGFVAAVGDRLNLTPAQRSVLVPYVNDLGNMYGTSGFNAFAMSSPDVRARATAEEAAFAARGRRLSDLTHLGRGGWIRNFANMVNDAGYSETSSWLMSVMKGFGMVSQRDVDIAEGRGTIGGIAGADAGLGAVLAGPSGGLLGGLYGAGQGVNAVLDRRSWIDRLLEGSSLRPGVQGAPLNRGPWGGGNPLADLGGAAAEAGRDVFNRAQKPMQVSMTIGVLKIERDGSATLTGGGSANF